MAHGTVCPVPLQASRDAEGGGWERPTEPGLARGAPSQPEDEPPGSSAGASHGTHEAQGMGSVLAVGKHMRDFKHRCPCAHRRSMGSYTKYVTVLPTEKRLRPDLQHPESTSRTHSSLEFFNKHKTHRN